MIKRRKVHDDGVPKAQATKSEPNHDQHDQKKSKKIARAQRDRHVEQPRRQIGVAYYAAWLVLPLVAFVVTNWPYVVETVHRWQLRSMKHSLPFHVVDLPGKGKGVVALRDIQQGELLIREEPLFILPTSTQGNPSVLINRTLAPLSYAQRISFFSLSFMPEDVEGYDAIALATLQTNAISAADGIGIFPATARLNHGCSRAFNAVYSWRDREQILVVHALKAIRRGEEILTTYTDTKRPRSERRSFLQSHYHFHCSCSVCSLPDALSRKSDDRLTKMSAKFQELASWGTESIDGVRASEIASEIWHLGEEEGYWSERGRLAADIVHVAAAHSDADSAISWGKLAAEWYTYELGSDSDLTISVRNTVANPDSHPAWGTRSRQRIKTLTPWHCHI